MSFEISGILIAKYDTTTISDKFKKREFVIEKKDNSGGFEFVDFIKFQLVQDKCAILDPYKSGDELKVSFNLRGRKWEKDGTTSYFTNLEAWKIEKLNIEKNSTSLSEPPDDLSPLPGEDDFSSNGQEMDDLPF
ncbi:MAG: DUF3127 domain-containing protein [Bacteroidales bacterium]|nr:DUF3127 domain-containing protein [Bacteroidales bacterium]